ncbi:FAD-dependent oxidoreductase [Actinosynnema sp. NPDC059797]
MRRVVIIGYGMAGARLAEEIRRRDPAGERVAVTAVGEEKHHPYNRVLLSSVVDGSLAAEAVTLQDADWAVEHAVDLRLGIGVTAVDRTTRTVFLADGSTIDYDVAVLATGARAWLPPVDGLAGAGGAPAAGVLTLRTLDDCERVRHAAGTGGSVAVLGGGLLGVEAARALAARGDRVTVVHPVAHLMERQLDPTAGEVLARVLDRLGVQVRAGARPTRYVPGRGLELAGGGLVPADHVLVSAGVRPEVGLAERAGLATDGGVLVDDALRTSDARVHAIGDCARHPGTVSGLVQPAWEQAAVLADLITGTDVSARYRGTPVVTRLKARDVDLVALGDARTRVDDPDAEVVCLTDFSRGRYAKLVVRDEEVAGAIVLGAPDVAAALTRFSDQRLPVPADRLPLLLGRSGAAPGPGEWPDAGLVCRCNAVTKAALVSAWHGGARRVADLADATRATTGCGGCVDRVRGLADWLSDREGDRAPA